MNLEAVMKRIALLSATALIATLASSGAYALSNRTFVSGNGNDNNPCSIAAPCRSFAGALTQTNAGGEIVALDSAGYGAVTISKAVSIIGPDGIEAGVTTSAAGDAITITAGATDVVNLRGLTLVGGGVGTNGITINSAGSVNIQNSVIRGFTQNGINMVVVNAGGSSNLRVIDTTVSNNANGVLVQPAGSNLTARAVFKRVQAIGNTAVGLLVVGGAGTGSSFVKSTAIDTLASGNGVDGFSGTATSELANTTDFELINCQAVENGTGVLNSNVTVNIFLAQTTISDNAIGYDNSGGTIWSFGNNYIAPNNTNHGSLAPMAQQ
jgi:hypothetical protein